MGRFVFLLFTLLSSMMVRINWDKMVEITKSAFLCLWKMANL